MPNAVALIRDFQIHSHDDQTSVTEDDHPKGGHFVRKPVQAEVAVTNEVENSLKLKTIVYCSGHFLPLETRTKGPPTLPKKANAVRIQNGLNRRCRTYVFPLRLPPLS